MILSEENSDPSKVFKFQYLSLNSMLETSVDRYIFIFFAIYLAHSFHFLQTIVDDFEIFC